MESKKRIFWNFLQTYEHYSDEYPYEYYSDEDNSDEITKKRRHHHFQVRH